MSTGQRIFIAAWATAHWAVIAWAFCFGAYDMEHGDHATRPSGLAALYYLIAALSTLSYLALLWVLFYRREPD